MGIGVTASVLAALAACGAGPDPRADPDASAADGSAPTEGDAIVRDGSRALELAVHGSPRDVPDACEVLDLEPATTVPARIAPPVVASATRADEIHLLVTGDDESWLRVESCEVEVRDDGSRR